jgi:hypothetical protein
MADKSRTILLGAGASAEAGVPVATEMARVVYARISETNHGEAEGIRVALGGLRLHRSIAYRDPYGEIDIEDLYETLNLLGRRENHLLSPFVGTWSHILSAGGYSFDNLADLVLKEVVDLCHVTSADRIAYLRPLASSARHCRLWIASLNYDNALELAAESSGVPIDVGLSAGGIRFRRDSLLCLAKLHGSIDWFLAMRGAFRNSNTPFTSAAFLFGSGNKLTAEGPYLDLLLAFREKLEETESLHVCGYSFRDPHINHLLLRWLMGNSYRQMQVIDPVLSLQQIILNVRRSLSGRQWIHPDPLERQTEVVPLTMAEWVIRIFGASPADDGEKEREKL